MPCTTLGDLLFFWLSRVKSILKSSHDIQPKRQGMCLARPQGGHRPASAVEGERRVLISLKPQWTREASQPGSTMASCAGCLSADARREVEAVQHYWPVLILFLLDGILAPEINHGRPSERVGGFRSIRHSCPCSVPARPSVVTYGASITVISSSKTDSV